MRNKNDKTRDALLDAVTEYYLGSSDFNGITAAELSEMLAIDWSSLRETLTELIDDGLIGVLYSDAEVNTHILRLRFEDKQTQISKLVTEELFHTCIYPLEKQLVLFVNQSDYRDRPYQLALTLGSPQLAYCSFDLSILEQYRNDPRYSYHCDDIRGAIFDADNSLAASDQIILNHFGFSYDDDFNRAVACYVRDLADLSPEHQLIWKNRELVGDYRLHPDFYRNTILGEWGEGVSVFDALIYELYAINKMAEAMNRPPLFHHDYGEFGEDKPRKFGFLVRPTLEEFNSFVLLLDQLLSDNINKRFFQNDLPLETETTRKDGKTIVTQKGTLLILDEWVRKFYRPYDWEPWNTTISSLRRVRKMRQKPAHSIDENVFDQTYFRAQRELITQAYDAVRTLRMLLENHPAVQQAKIQIPDHIREGKIWTY